MHELGIVFYIIRDVEDVVEKNEVTEVKSVTLQLGEVSGVIPSYLLDVFNTYAQETLHIDKELLPVTDREEKAPAGSLQILQEV